MTGIQALWVLTGLALAALGVVLGLYIWLIRR